MISYERQQALLGYLREKHFATIKELSGQIWASESSVRRDIDQLEKKGYVNKIYGGVVLAEYRNSIVPVGLRDSQNSAVKEALAKKAAKLVFDGATLILDGSSTVRRILNYLDGYLELTIITNNQRIFNECTNQDIKLYCTGGYFLNQSNIFVGSAAENFIRGISADLLFFSGQALSDDGEISDVSEEETSLRKVMLARSKKKIFLCDSSKLGMVKTFTICTKDDVDQILCDKPLPWEAQRSSR